jgi:hypothetical protein
MTTEYGIQEGSTCLALLYDTESYLRLEYIDAIV